MKRAREITIQFCVGGKLVRGDHVQGRSLYLDAILETEPDTVFGVGECKHDACLRVNVLEDSDVEPLMRFLACKTPHILFQPLSALVDKSDYLAIPLEFVIATIKLPNMPAEDVAYLHSVNMQRRFVQLFQKSPEPGKDKEALKTITLPAWPPCKVMNFKKVDDSYRHPRGDFDLNPYYKDVCKAVMAEPLIGDWLERLNLVRKLHPHTVALLEVTNVFEAVEAVEAVEAKDEGGDEEREGDFNDWVVRFAPTGGDPHLAMVALLGRDVVDCLPKTAIVAGGAVVHAVGGSPLLEGSDVDVFVPTELDAEGLIKDLTDLGFKKHATNKSMWSGIRGKQCKQCIQIICANTACDVKVLIPNFDWDYVQIAWLPSKKRVVATLDCLRALITRVCSVMMGCTTESRKRKAEEKGFRMARNLLDVRFNPDADFDHDPQKETRIVIGNFARSSNYNKHAKEEDGVFNRSIHPRMPVEFLAGSHSRGVKVFISPAMVEITGAALITPLVYCKAGNLHYNSRWSKEHANFTQIVHHVHKQVGVPPHPTPDTIDVETANELWIGKRVQFWGRFEIAPIYSRMDQYNIKWNILSYATYERSPFAHFNLSFDT